MAATLGRPRHGGAAGMRPCTHEPACTTRACALSAAAVTAPRFLVDNAADGAAAASGGFEPPMQCPSPGPRPCTGTNFRRVDGPGASVYTNHQELRLQEQLQCLEPGSVPASMAVVLTDELADSCQPGGARCCCCSPPLAAYMSASSQQLARIAHATSTASSAACLPHRCATCDCADDVEVTGLVRAAWRPLFPGARCDGTITLRACHLRCISSLHRAAAPPPEGLAEQFRLGAAAATASMALAMPAATLLLACARMAAHTASLHAPRLPPLSACAPQRLLGLPRGLPAQGPQQDPRQHLPADLRPLPREARGRPHAHRRLRAPRRQRHAHPRRGAHAAHRRPRHRQVAGAAAAAAAAACMRSASADCEACACTSQCPRVCAEPHVTCVY